VQAAASDSGPIDLNYQIEHKQLLTVVEKFMGGPPEGARAALYKRASPSSYVGEKSLPPLLLMYGEVDGQVDVRSADAFVAALSSAGHTQISYFRLAGVDHCPHSIARVPYLKGVVEDFFLQALKPAPAEKN
jgi:dipeptidyl aminopeptidase/acylaminoacyl peptidase